MERSNLVHSAVLISCLILGLLLEGCVAGPQQEARPSVGPASKVTTASQIKLPLSAYLMSEQDRESLQRAAFKLQAECASRFGVRMDPFEVDRASIRAEINLARRYGLVDRAEVELYGYDYAPHPEDKESDKGKGSAEEDEVISGLTEDGSTSEMKDSSGNPMPDGGCGREGFEKVRGDVPLDFDNLPRQLLDDARTRMEVDQDYKKAEADWAVCMKGAGYSFEHPYEAGNSVLGKSEAEQRDMALLDLDCAQKVNFAGRAMAVDVAYQQQLISSNEGPLRSVLDQKRSLMENVKRAIR